MGITYQTNNRQRRKVMTAPLNAPPQELGEAVPAIADAPALDAEATPGPARLGSLVAALLGAALAAAALNYLL